MSEKLRTSQPPKETIAPRHESLRKEFEHGTGPAPLGYGEVRLWLVARGPRAIFAYWEFRPEEHPEAVAADGEAHFILRVLREDGSVETTCEVQPAAGDWTVSVQAADTNYFTELGFYTRQGVWCFLARSGMTRTLPDPGAVPGPKTGAEVLFELEGRVQAEWTAVQEARLSDLLAEETRKAADRRLPKRSRRQSPPRRK